MLLLIQIIVVSDNCEGRKQFNEWYTTARGTISESRMCKHCNIRQCSDRKKWSIVYKIITMIWIWIQRHQHHLKTVYYST